MSTSPRYCISPLASVAVGLALALAVGCAATPTRTEPLRVSISDIEPLGLDLLEQRCVVTLHIENGREDALHVQGMSYLIRLNGEEFSRGESLDPFTVPARSERLIQLIVVSDLMQLLAQLRTLARQKDPRLRYAIEGAFRLEGRSTRVPFVFEDELSLPSRERRRKIEAI